VKGSENMAEGGPRARRILGEMPLDLKKTERTMVQGLRDVFANLGRALEE